MRAVGARVVGAIVAVLVLLTPGCASIPREPVPAGWALNVHQPGEWWLQPLIPRSVVVQRCPPQPGWSSTPNLIVTDAVPPGSDINYFLLTDDYHCDVGWAKPTSETQIAVAELNAKANLRRICSTSGLPMDAGWRYLGNNLTGGFQQSGPVRTAAFIDEYATVVACHVVLQPEEDSALAAFVQLSVGADVAGGASEPSCPVGLSGVARGDRDTVGQYDLRGAGVVRGSDGRVLTKAASVTLVLDGDTVTTTHPVVDGVAIAGVTVTPQAAVHFADWDHLPAVRGEVRDAEGNLLATCRG